MEEEKPLKNFPLQDHNTSTPHADGDQGLKKNRKIGKVYEKPQPDVESDKLEIPITDEDWENLSDDYEFVHEEVMSDDGEHRMMLPAYRFPGTWEGAYHDTAKAATEVANASKSYYDELANSSLSKAACSIGGALMNTANVGALTAATYTINASGTDRSRLPTFVDKWLKTKDEIDEARQRAEEAEKERQIRKYKMELIKSGQVMEVPHDDDLE